MWCHPVYDKLSRALNLMLLPRINFQEQINGQSNKDDLKSSDTFIGLDHIFSNRGFIVQLGLHYLIL